MTYPKPAIYRVKLESGLVTENDMLPMGHCQYLPPLCPLQVKTAVDGSQQALPCWSIGTVGQEPVVDGVMISIHVGIPLIVPTCAFGLKF